MKMLVLVYNYLLEEEVHALLAMMDVAAYSKVPKILGSGKSGRVEDSRYAPGYNRLIFAVLPNEQVGPLVERFREIVGTHKQNGRSVGIHAFELPCEQLL